MTGVVDVAVSQQRQAPSFTPNSTAGTSPGSQVPWLADRTYYLRRPRPLTDALMCCMLALLLVWPGIVGFSSASPSLSPHHLLQSLTWADTSRPF